MKEIKGFTLVELLVVIAIISILAAIAIPSVSGFIEDAQVGNAEATVTNVETAVTGMLADVGRKNFRTMFTPSFRQQVDALDITDPAQFQTAVDLYTDMMYRLLRQGRSAYEGQASAPIQADLLQKFGTSYMSDLEEDPWGNRYLFFLGPLRRDAVPLRKYRLDVFAPTVEGLRNPMLWNSTSRTEVEKDSVPGLPRADDAFGIPADTDRPVYVWSVGKNLQSDQGKVKLSDVSVPTEFLGGGDDINNWDRGNSGKGWKVFY